MKGTYKSKPSVPPKAGLGPATTNGLLYYRIAHQRYRRIGQMVRQWLACCKVQAGDGMCCRLNDAAGAICRQPIRHQVPFVARHEHRKFV